VSTVVFTSPPAEDIPVQDKALLHLLASTIASAAQAVPVEHCGSLPLVAHTRNDGGLAQRIVLFHRLASLNTYPCAFVGFIGKKSERLTRELLEAVTHADEHIMDGLVGQGEVLAYASLELPDQNWGNLVLLHHAGATTVLREQPSHRYAAHELAPRFYQWIHLYHGAFPQGLGEHASALSITRVHRYMFGDSHDDINH
jgi:hypothetical protein